MKKIITFPARFFDLKAGLLIAFFMGSVVFCINYFATNLLTLSLIAAGKQWVYTFLLSGSVLKSTEYLVNAIPSRKIAIPVATLLPAIVTLLLVFGLHSLKGTPRPVESTLPALFVIPGTLFWAIRKRKNMENKNNQ